MSTLAWAPLTNSSTAPEDSSRNGSAPTRSSGADEAASTEAVIPARREYSIAASPADRDPSDSSVYPETCTWAPGMNRSCGRSSGDSAAFAPGSDSMVRSPLCVTITTQVPVGRSGSMTRRASTP